MRTNMNYVDADVLFSATNDLAKIIKEDLIITTKSIAKYNSLATLVTKEMKINTVVRNEILINRDNVLRSAVKKIFFLNDMIKANTGMLLVTKRINRSNMTQCVDMLDSFWFALWEVADRKSALRNE